MVGRPADACPYPKPFAADFNDCPTYQTRHAIVVDSNDRPLHTIWSCRHMETKQVPGEPGHYYGACQLGDAKGRQHWVQLIGPERIVARRPFVEPAEVRLRVCVRRQRVGEDRDQAEGDHHEASGHGEPVAPEPPEGVARQRAGPRVSTGCEGQGSRRQDPP